MTLQQPSNTRIPCWQQGPALRPSWKQAWQIFPITVRQYPNCWMVISKKYMLTATKVPGKKNIPRTAIVFIGELSLLVSTAIPRLTALSSLLALATIANLFARSIFTFVSFSYLIKRLYLKLSEANSKASLVGFVGCDGVGGAMEPGTPPLWVTWFAIGLYFSNKACFRIQPYFQCPRLRST